MIERERIAALVLAGGLSRRMGGRDKGLLELAGRTLIGHVRNRLAGQASMILLNANGDPARFARQDLPVVADLVAGHAGPLAGIHAGMAWIAENRPQLTHIVTAAADTPFLPLDLASKLSAALRGGATIALAGSGGRAHPVFGFWPISLAPELHAFLETGESRKVMAFVERYGHVIVEFGPGKAGAEAIDPFFNINTPADHERARRLWQAMHATPSL